MPTTMRITSTDGLTLTAHETGGSGDPAGPTVVCIHGYPDNSAIWDGVVAELAPRYRVVTYDVRGAGDSDAPTSRAGYRLDQLVADLGAVIDAVSPDDPVHVLAHDWGSIQSWPALTDERLAGRIASFTSISGPDLDQAGAWMRSALRPGGARLRDVVRQLLESYYILLFNLPVLPELMCRTGMLRRLVAASSAIGRGSAPAGRAPRPAPADQLNGLQLYRANMFRRLSRPKPRATAVPVQVIAPTLDLFASPALQFGAPRRWAADLRTRSVAGGHWVVATRPSVIARMAGELIDHVEGGPEPRALVKARMPIRRKGFDGRLVVITGAGRGIGRATALAFAERGADIVAADIDDAATADTVHAVRRLGVDAAGYHLDVSDGDAFERFAKQVRADYDVPDTVVNNAGIGLAGPFLATSVADWDRILDINLWGVIHGSRLFGQQLLDRGQGGQIVNVASAAAYSPSRVLPAYATTKAAVLMLSQCLRAELGRDGIGVVAICPGFVNSDITRTTRYVGGDAESQERQRQQAMAAYARRNYTPSQVARHIVAASARNRPIARITPEAKVFDALSRFTPALARGMARVDLNG
jgi:NAD(P)-dependent dehydrogenase (short-subunit alcohol dehydrogenase family)/pimeloyl-ACP methyl ester carboxylesterase